MTQHPDRSGPARRWTWLVGAVAAVVVLGLAGWAVADRSDPAETDDAATATPTSQVTPTPSASASASAEPSASGGTPSPVVPTEQPTAVASDAAGERSTLDDVAPREVARPSKDVSIRIARVQSVRSKVVLPEDTAGPALRLTIRVANGQSRLLDTRFAVVNAYYGDDQRPANQFSQPGGRPFPPSIGAGSAGRAVYLFGIPRDQRDNVTIEVDLAPQLPVARFVGSFR